MARSEAAQEQGHGAQLTLNLTKKVASDRKKKISELMQKMADIRTDLANEYKAFEEEGGDRKMLKVILRMENQDKSKTRSELRALDQYRQWFLPNADKDDDDED